MSTPLLASFAPRIEIDVQPEIFTYRCESSSFSCATVIWLIDGPKGRRIEIFGEGTPSPAAVEIRLFSGPSPDPDDPDFLFELLTRFVCHGIRAVQRRRRYLRPRVTIKGARSLDPRLGGFQANILRAAVRTAGAMEVTFPASGGASTTRAGLPP